MENLTKQDKGLATMKADHLLISVTNFEETIAWYQEKLGFKLEVQWKVDGMDTVDLAYLVGAGFRLEIIGNKGAEQNNKQVANFNEHLGHQGFTHLCFQVEDVDLALKQLNDKGVETFFPASTFPVGHYERRIGMVKDLNGNVIEFGGPLKG